MYGLVRPNPLIIMRSLITMNRAAQCSKTTVRSRDVYKGTIQRGLFFNGVGLQAYAPGQDCRWRLSFGRQVKITFTFATVALGYDALDYVNVTQTRSGALIKKVTGIGTNIVVNATGSDFSVRFVTYGGRSPYPISAGFIMHYTATGALLILNIFWFSSVSCGMIRLFMGCLIQFFFWSFLAPIAVLTC